MIKKIKIGILTLGTIIAVMIFVVIVMRSFVFDLMIIRGDSMSPTIMQGDRVMVNKMTYSFRKPKRGDIIALKIVHKRLIKRIIGLPGDIIEVKDGRLYRNGKEVVQGWYPYNINRGSYGPRIIRDKYIFVMGDNRILSMDSRDFGPIPYKDVIGEVVFIYSPWGRIGEPKYASGKTKPSERAIPILSPKVIDAKSKR
jgi:signal peptidase I